MREFKKKMEEISKKENQLLILAEYYHPNSNDAMMLVARKSIYPRELSRMKPSDIEDIEYSRLAKIELKNGIEYDHLEQYAVYYNGSWYYTPEELLEKLDY